MTIKELEEYQVICSKGSLSKAAKALFITPQGLSRVLKNLEAELNCTLVNRVASGLELTESGKCLQEYARKVTAEYGKLKEKIESIQERAYGSVELLMAYDVIRLLGTDCFADFQKKHPQISVTCWEYPDRIAERMLAEDQGNLGISIGPFAGELFEIHPLVKRRLCLIAPEDHPLAAKAEVTVEDLKDQPLCMENSSFKINEFVQRQCWLKGFEPDIEFEASSFDICYKMCRMKKGISVVPDFVHEDMKTDTLVQIPFAEPEMEMEIALLIPKHRPREHAVATFCNYVKER